MSIQIYDMIIIDITEEQIKRATKLYDFKVLKNSITKGESNIYGALGEIITYDYYSKLFPVVFENTYDYDMIIGGHKIDVKSKKTTVPPKPNYNCSIANYNITQKCDFYHFCRIHENLKVGYLLGFSKKEDFFTLAEFKQKGQSDGANFKFTTDCYNLPISSLKNTLEII